MPTADERQYLNVSATYSHSNSVAEQTVVTFTPAQNTVFRGMWLDLFNLTQNATVRVRYNQAGTGTFNVFETKLFTAASAIDGIVIGRKVPNHRQIRITLQGEVLEGASRDVPYEYWYVNLGAVPA